MTPAERTPQCDLCRAVAGALNDIADRFLGDMEGPRLLGNWERDTCEAINVDRRTFQRWREGTSLPSFLKAIRLFDHFGPDFADKVTILAGLVTARAGDVGIVGDAKNYRCAMKALSGIEVIIKGTNEMLRDPDPLAAEREAAE